MARLAAGTFRVPFVQIVRFGNGGDGMAAVPTSYGALGEAIPDLRLACTALPADAALVVVEDATRDARMVLPSDARFFAYARIEAADGRILGGVCLLDDAPRHLDAAQSEHLADIAALSADVMEAREQVSEAEARAEAEARFQALSDTVFDALLILDGSTILDANEQAAALLGVHSAEALIGQTVLDYIPLRLQQVVQVQLAEPGRYETVLAQVDAREAPIQLRVATFPYSGRTLSVTAVRPLERA